ncbi:hypothetical protein [Flammeovirga sp. EKP202]|uniref:hypothetical protein n=1 Tax=Flammeovirga sp. EKP202 TaxID=2770592 RepID=UPI0016600340|nr:hypothetical protein [Flammeovirga sp. EKP202]MBD0399984.1 hypothetical protein [Flammeovirga sp. EKP202]
MDRLNQSHSGKGDNIGRDKITNNIQVANDILIRKVQESYSKVYHWHKKYGKKIFSQFFEDDLSEEEANDYFELIDTMPGPEHAELDEMVSVCKQFHGGCLTWSSSEYVEPINKKYRLIKFAKEVLNAKNNFTARKFENISLDNPKEYYEESLKLLLSTNPELKKIQDQEYLDRKIGGKNAIIESSKQFGEPFILTPELLGFKVIDDQKSLIEKVEKDEIKIDNIYFETYSGGTKVDGTRYYVKIELTNQTDEKIKAFLPEGQIFENEKYEFVEKPSQNLAITNAWKIELNANETKTFELPAYCINKHFESPDHKKGFITIYEFAKKKFSKNKEVWEWIQTNYNRIIEKFK